jgi:hypothetical protein
MNPTSRLKKEIIVLVGSVALLYLAALLCGITKTLFATPTSAFGGVLLLLACRSLVASLFRSSASTPRAHKA